MRAAATSGLRAEASGTRPWWLRLVPFWLGLLLVTGVGLHMAQEHRHEVAERLQAQLLAQAEGLARHVDPRLIQALSRGSADAEGATFQILREQLVHLGTAFPNHGLFLLFQREGKVLVGPTSGIPALRKAPPEATALWLSGYGTVTGPQGEGRDVWVTALAPIRDGETGEVNLILGLEERASEWQGRLAKEHWTPDPAAFVLCLVFLAMAARLGWGPLWGKTDSLNLKGSILVPMALTIIAVAGVYAWREVAQSRAEQRQTMASLASQGEVFWDRRLAFERRLLEVQMDRISAERGLITALAAGDVAGLERLSHGLFQELQLRFGISKFYIAGTDRTCLLRVHHPTNRGGILGHDTLKQAQRRGADACGLEWGAEGALVLRFVRPCWRGGKIIGYLELGKDIHPELSRLAKDLAVDFVSLLRKEAITRETFESGKRLYHYAGSWDAFPEMVVLQQSLPALPEPLVQHFRLGMGGLKNLDTFPMMWDRRPMLGGVVHLVDGSGQELGAVVVLRDVSGAVAKTSTRIHMQLRLTGILLLAVLAALWMVTSQAERRFENLLHKVEDSEKNFRTFFQTLDDIVVVASREGHIIFGNEACTRKLGYSPEEMASKRVVELRQESSRGEAARVFEGMLRGEAEVCTLPMQRKDGGVLPVETRVLMGAWDGRPCIFTVSKDVSIQQAALERALAAVEARSRFLATISHEIRTPLNGLLGMAELLSDTELSAEQQEHVSWISRCGSSLLSFLNDILDFSKMDAGQLALETSSFDLCHLVYDTVDLFRSRLVGHPVELRVDYDAATPIQFLGDAGRFRQILNNLVSNAVKFTAKGQILIAVNGVPQLGGGYRLVIKVQDTGIGIAPEKQGLLFQPFVQAEASTTRKYGGTGLGLAIVKGLVEAMGGQISLQSEAGVGSSFTVEVDLQQDPSNPQVQESRAGLVGKRLLLVVDQRSNLEALRNQLRSQGAHLEAVASGAEALACLDEALARKAPYDLVVVELGLPGGMDAEALGLAIRADARCQGLALAALVATGVKGDPARLAEVGFDAYLHKPMSGEQLCGSLALTLQRAGQQPKKELITRYTLAGGRSSVPRSAPASLRGRILVVEDQEPNQIVLRKLLERAGATVTVAADGFQAVEAVLSGTFDLVLMDCQMPGMDGLEATAKIRADEQGTHRHLPIIAMTANAMEENRNQCLAAGMDDYLTKPIHREALFKVLVDWLQVGAEAQSESCSGEGPGVLVVADPALGLNQDLFEKLLELYDQDLRALGHDLLSPFLKSGEARLASMKACLAQEDFKGLAEGAHAIKGSARTIGLMVLGTLMERSEQAAKTGQRQGLEELLQEARRALDLARAFFQKLVE